MYEAHAMAGLFPGDYFIHRFEIGERILFAYGLLRLIDEVGKYHADYRCSQPPAQPAEIAQSKQRVVGRISRRAYELARMRGWPNTEAAVAAVIDYSAGKGVPLRWEERFRLFFVR
jgi:hypothetical protein